MKRIHQLAGIIWVVLLLMQGIYLFQGEIRIKTNILDLITSDNDSEQETLGRGKALLEKGSNYIRLGIKGEDKDLVLKIAAIITDDLKKNPLITIPPSSDLAETEVEMLETLSLARGHILSQEQISFLKSKPSAETIALRIQEKLTSSLGPYYARFLPYDPLLFIPEIMSTLSQQEILESKDNITFVETEEGSFFAYAFFIIDKKASRLDEQNALITEIDKLIDGNKETYKDIEIHWSGFIAFANESAQATKNDITRVSKWGGILLLPILLFLFRSPLPILLSIATILSGLIFGTVSSVLILGEIHILTLAFGTSLMGACIDYSLHYQCEHYLGSKKEKVFKKVFTPITLGALTSVLAFLSLSFSEFPGLKELSIFAIGSIIGSYLGVILWFPFLLRKGSILLNGLSAIDTNTSHNRFKIILPNILLLLIIPASLGLYSLEIKDDIRLLQKPSEKLINSERWLQEQIPHGTPSAFALIEGTSKAEVEKIAHEVTKVLSQLIEEDKALESYLSIYQFISPIVEQEESFATYRNFLKANEAELRNAFENELGFEDGLTKNVFEFDSLSPLTSENILRILPPMLRDLASVQERENGFWLSIPLYGVKENTSVSRRLDSIDGTYYYEHASEISKLFGKYRNKSIYLVCFAYLAVWIILCSRYGFRNGNLCLLPPLGSAFFSLSALGLIGEPLNFFAILALVIVLGFSVDCSIFIMEADKETRPIFYAISLSTISTICTFGVLSLSSTPVLKSFGLIISIGIFFSYLIAISILTRMIKA